DACGPEFNPQTNVPCGDTYLAKANGGELLVLVLAGVAKELNLGMALHSSGVQGNFRKTATSQTKNKKAWRRTSRIACPSSCALIGKPIHARVSGEEVRNGGSSETSPILRIESPYGRNTPIGREASSW